MIKRFRGEWVNKVDGKGRVSIPAPFRRVLEHCDPDWNENCYASLVLVYGRTGNGCLEGYSIYSIQEVDNMISALPRYSKNREILERLLNSNSLQIQVDENGRIVLPSKLRELINLEGEALFAGMGEKFQIWHPDAYEVSMQKIYELIKNPKNEQDIFDLLDSKNIQKFTDKADG